MTKAKRVRLETKIGTRYGAWTVISEPYQIINDKGQKYWHVDARCDCGLEKNVELMSLYLGNSPSCGCVRRLKESEIPIGTVFTYLTVIGPPHYSTETKGGYREAHVLCKCICGKEKDIATNELNFGLVKSCGCKTKEMQGYKEDARKRKRMYKLWACMLLRCKPGMSTSKYWGDKGIKVCEEWQDFDKFEAWALANGYADNLTIDRVDSSKNYEPSNCRWVSRADNARNLTAERDKTIAAQKLRIHELEEEVKQLKEENACLNEQLALESELNIFS